MNKLIKYLKETKVELRHVNWPTRNQAFNYTAIVIGLSILVGIYLGVFDALFSYLIMKLI
ncbi:MAG TPA: preprotein translocase subunit SecE [Candidatus Vogelbacteria bacterium]|nr:preprotein translocase subunit SecE [Candidatus Vogelbacteria bacterium]